MTAPQTKGRTLAMLSRRHFLLGTTSLSAAALAGLGAGSASALSTKPVKDTAAKTATTITPATLPHRSALNLNFGEVCREHRYINCAKSAQRVIGGGSNITTYYQKINANNYPTETTD